MLPYGIIHMVTNIDTNDAIEKFKRMVPHILWTPFNFISINFKVKSVKYLESVIHMHGLS